MNSTVRSHTRTATDVTSYLVSKAFAVVAIKRTSLGFLTKLNTYDLVSNRISSTESFQIMASNSYGEVIKLEYEGDNARKVHRIFM